MYSGGVWGSDGIWENDEVGGGGVNGVGLGGTESKGLWQSTWQVGY